jgi:hypothetical protein
MVRLVTNIGILRGSRKESRRAVVLTGKEIN